MDQQRTNLLSTATRCTFYVISRTVLFTVLGLVLNLVLLAFLWPELSTLASNVPGIPAARAGGVGAVLALVALTITSFPLLAVVLGFLVVFPVVHLLMGKRHGVAKAVAFVTGRYAEPVADYLRDRVVAYAETPRGAELVARASKGGEKLPGLLGRLDDLPRALRFVVRHLAGKLDVGGVLSAVAAERQARGGAVLDPQRDAGAIRDQLLRKLQEKFGTAGLGWFWILLAVNLAAFVAVKVLM